MNQIYKGPKGTSNDIERIQLLRGGDFGDLTLQWWCDYCERRMW